MSQSISPGMWPAIWPLPQATRRGCNLLIYGVVAVSNALLKAQQMRIPWNLCHDKVHNLNKRTIWEGRETQSQKQERKQACVYGRQGETEQTLCSTPSACLGHNWETGLKQGLWHTSSPSIWILKMTRHLVGKMWVWRDCLPWPRIMPPMVTLLYVTLYHKQIQFQ